MGVLLRSMVLVTEGFTIGALILWLQIHDKGSFGLVERKNTIKYLAMSEGKTVSRFFSLNVVA